ncbi:MAG: ADP-ribosylglycohydrolase family protein, partial [Lysobacterales bacterium]
MAKSKPSAPGLTRRAMLRVAAGSALLAGGAALTGPRAAVAAPGDEFERRVAASLYGMAIGDGMGAPVEGWQPAAIEARFADWDFRRFLPSTPENHRGPGPGKGEGRLTDDMLLVEALIRAYIARGDHLDAYDYAQYFIPEIAEREVWVPEKQAMITPLQRPLWWPERYAYHRLAINNVEPRTGGLGNWTNQGLQGFVLPVAAVNAGDPDAAYAETVAWGAAHNHSFALEGAAVMAAVFAAAFAFGATAEDCIEAGVARARDGTRAALQAVLAEVDPADGLDRFIARVRAAYLPYAGLSPARLAAAEPDTTTLAGTDMGTASRIACIENLPVSLAALRYGRGDFVRTCETCIRYGQDCESIAAGSLGLLGALHGPAVIPEGLLRQSAEVNRRDYFELAAEFGRVVRRIAARDAQRLAQRQATLG